MDIENTISGGACQRKCILVVCVLGVTFSSLTIFLLLDRVLDNFVTPKARKEVKKGNFTGDLKVLFTREEGDK